MATSTTLPTDSFRPAAPPAGSPADPAAAAERRRWVMLAVLVTGQFMALLDVMIVVVAVPDIGRDLGASGSGLQLVLAGYTISYAMLLITGARLGSMFGARWVYFAGLLAFTGASLACGLAPGTGALIASRFVQGAGAAAMIPQVFSLIQREFIGAARTRALSIYATVIAAAAVVGQIVGGAVVNADLFGTSWRPIFLLNVPIGIALAVVVPRVVPADRQPGGRRLDVPGLLLSTASVLLIVLPLVLGREQGWPAWTWVSLAAGVVLAAVFVRVERWVAARGRHPLLDLDVLRAPGMAAGILALGLGMVTFGGFMFTLSVHLQSALGHSALATGLAYVPGAATFGLLGYYWRRLPARLHWAFVPAGFLLGAAGYLGIDLALRGGGDGGGWRIVFMLLFGTGFGLAFSPALTQALVRVPLRSAADASGLLTTTMQLAQVVGFTVFGAAYLGLAGSGPAHAISLVTGLEAAGALVAAGFGVALARTVRAARVPA
jgi:MFS family permease